MERKRIEDLAKEAGIQEDDVPVVVDLEMRMRMFLDEQEFDIKNMLVIDSMIVSIYNRILPIVQLKFRQSTVRNRGKINTC